MRRAILIAVALFCFIQQALAADAIVNGNKLNELCESSQESAVCLGYIIGAADAHVNDGSFCAPNDTIGGQMEDIVKRYLRVHPERRHFSAASLVVSALKEKFPCN